MIDRKKYEQEMDQARRDEIEYLSDYLRDYIKLNNEIRNLKINLDSDEECIKNIEKIDIPQKGRNLKDVADEIIENVYTKGMIIQHPKFFSFVTSAVSPYSLAGAVLSNIYNLNACGIELSQSGAVIEQKLVEWMGSRAGFDPEKCGGIFTSGGSLSNLTGMIAGRDNILSEEERPIGVAYLSDQAHSSVYKGMKMMGLRKDQIRRLPCDDEYKLDPKVLEEAIKEDLAAGKKPFLVVATLGTTNTGAIDPFDKIADIRDKYHMWMHVDGAYGGSSLISDIYRNLSAGIERADSLSWDTHKWALQTYSCSTVIARDKNTFKTVFAEHPEYLADIISEESYDGWDMGIEMSRPQRYMKLWFTLQCLGTDKMADIIDYSFFNAKVAEKELNRLDDVEITSRPSCGCITFRFTPKEMDPSKYDDYNMAISQRIIEDGEAYIVTTVIKGKRVLRLCLINGNTTDEDVISTVHYLGKLSKQLKKDYIG